MSKHEECKDSPPFWVVPGICVLLAAMVWLVFGQTLRHGFVNYDDSIYVYDNPEIKNGITSNNIGNAFTHFHAFNWHPLTTISHMLDCQFYGLQPWGHHLTNVLLHGMTAIALFLVLRQMTGALWPCAFVAAVFAIHPLRVESVAWVSERKDVLSGLFFMLTLAAYTRYARRPWSMMRYLSVICIYALGLMSKPTLVTMPFVLLLLDYWPLRRFPRDTPGTGIGRLVAEKIPLLILSAASCLATIIAQKEAIQPLGTSPFVERIANALVSYAVYIRQMFYPIKLAALYPRLQNGPPQMEIIFAAAFLSSITAAAFLLRKRWPYLITGWLWYLGMLMPMIGIMQVGAQAHADRYTYLPQIGLYILLAWALADACKSWHDYRLMIPAGAAAVIIGLLIFCAQKQTSYWRDSESLWNHTIASTGENAIAQDNLSRALARDGRLEDALVHCRMALQIQPNYSEANYNMALLLEMTGATDEAMAYFQKAEQLVPFSSEDQNNLGAALYKKGQLDEAILHFQKAVDINPGNAEAQDNLGAALIQKDQGDEAISHFQKALEIQPDFAKAHGNLGVILLQKGRPDEALVHLQKALETPSSQPDAAGIHYLLANTFLQKGRVAEAIPHYQKAVELQPHYVEAETNLANLLATSPQESLRNGAKALELALDANQSTGGSNPIVLGTLAAAYAETGRFPEAVEAAQHALDLANFQSNASLSNVFRSQIALYKAGKPFRSNSAGK